MNRTIAALLVLLPAGQLAAAPPASEPSRNQPKNAIEARIVNAEANARQRELEIRKEVSERQSPAVQAEFAAMMEELDRGTDKPASASALEPADPAR